jgi:hypothetical protein
MNAVVDPTIPDLQWSEDGYAALSGALLEKAMELDAVFRDWAGDLGATEYRFPAMIPVRSLAPIAYLRSFPHLATFATSGRRSDEALTSIAEECGTAERIPASEEFLDPVEQILTPAACYHFYPRLAGSRLTSPLVVTTKCQCHRREQEYLPLQRQWCFEMRELVCIGDPDAIEEFTEDCRGRIEALVAALRIDAAWQTATDPFFDPAADPKALAQLVEPVKKELCTGDGLAIASVNLHRRFFGECYDIRHGNGAANSACVAFGIERWLYALMEVHGPDVAAWPDVGRKR